MGMGAGEEAGGGARGRAGEYRSLAARAGDRERARAAVAAAAGRRREGAGRALAAGAAQTAGFRRAVAELAQAALEKQRAQLGGGARDSARGERGARIPGAGPPPTPGASSPELERFKKRVQECQVRRLQEQVEEQRTQLEEQSGGGGGEKGEPPAPEFLQVLEAQTLRLSEITRQIGRIESILSPGRAKEQGLRERIRAVCEEHEQAEGEGGGKGGGMRRGSPASPAGAPPHRAEDAGAGGVQAQAEEGSAVEPVGVPQQEEGPSPPPAGEGGPKPGGGGKRGPVEGSDGVWRALRAIQARCDAQEKATEDLQQELRSFYGAFSEALGEGGGTPTAAPAGKRPEEGSPSPASQVEP